MTTCGIDTGVEELHTKALYASNFAGVNCFVKSRPLSILFFNSGNNFSFTKTIVLFLTPPVVPSNRLYVIPFILNPFL